jgi:hypothetical protein
MKAQLVLAVLTMALLMGCNKSDSNSSGACNAGKKNVDVSADHLLNEDFPLFDGSPPADNKVAYYYQPDSTIQFIFGVNVSDVCSKEHFKIRFVALFGDLAPMSSFKVFGEAYYGFAQRDVNLTLGTGLDKEMTGELEVGLAQQFENKPGNVDIYLTIEFKSLGSKNLDFAVFESHVQKMRIVADYSLH